MNSLRKSVIFGFRFNLSGTMCFWPLVSDWCLFILRHQEPGYIGFPKSCQIHYVFVQRLRLRVENGDGSSDSNTHTSTSGKRLIKRVRCRFIRCPQAHRLERACSVDGVGEREAGSAQVLERGHSCILSLVAHLPSACSLPSPQSFHTRLMISRGFDIPVGDKGLLATLTHHPDPLSEPAGVKQWLTTEPRHFFISS